MWRRSRQGAPEMDLGSSGDRIEMDLKRVSEHRRASPWRRVFF